MARTTTPRVTKQAPTIMRTLDYKGYRICRMSNDEVWLYSPEGEHTPVENTAAGREIVDSRLSEYKGKGHGGYSINPPENCKYKCRFEGETPWWVDNIICHGTCEVNNNCATFNRLMAGSRERISKLKTGE